MTKQIEPCPVGAIANEIHRMLDQRDLQHHFRTHVNNILGMVNRLKASTYMTYSELLWKTLAPELDERKYTYTVETDIGENVTYWDGTKWTNTTLGLKSTVLCRSPKKPKWEVGQLWKSESGRWLRKIVHLNDKHVTLELVEALLDVMDTGNYIGEVTTYHVGVNPLLTSTLVDKP